jgi:hypothetical protein
MYNNERRQLPQNSAHHVPAPETHNRGLSAKCRQSRRSRGGAGPNGHPPRPRPALAEQHNGLRPRSSVRSRRNSPASKHMLAQEQPESPQPAPAEGLPRPPQRSGAAVVWAPPRGAEAAAEPESDPGQLAAPVAANRMSGPPQSRCLPEAEAQGYKRAVPRKRVEPDTRARRLPVVPRSRSPAPPRRRLSGPPSICWYSEDLAVSYSLGWTFRVVPCFGKNASKSRAGL